MADETTSAISSKEQTLGAQIASLSLVRVCKSSTGMACHENRNIIWPFIMSI